MYITIYFSMSSKEVQFNFALLKLIQMSLIEVCHLAYSCTTKNFIENYIILTIYL